MTRRHLFSVFAVWATGVAVFLAGLIVVGSNTKMCSQRVPSATCEEACVAAEHLKCVWPLWGTPDLVIALIFLVSLSSVVLATVLVYRQALRRRRQGTSA
jgi:hydrogenase-4 membrane subunit HyfE